MKCCNRLTARAHVVNHVGARRSFKGPQLLALQEFDVSVENREWSLKDRELAEAQGVGGSLEVLRR